MSRQPIFDCVRELIGRGFTSNEVADLDAAIDAAGISSDERPTAPVRDAFDHALEIILRHEGGYSNHPLDRGGVTNLGITKAVWEDYVGGKATEADMRALTPAKVAPLYRANYWDRLRCAELHPALALCVFDFGVNSGTRRAARYLQRLVGSPDDGSVGPSTIKAAQAYVFAHEAAAAVKAYSRMREAFYRDLNTFPTFGKGWLRRVAETETEALRLA